MSRAYRVRLAETLARVVAVADGVEAQLELLPLLGRERMAALLEDELVDAGFTVAEGRARRGGVEVTLATLRVHVRARREAELSVAGDIAVATPLAGRAAAEEEARGRLREELTRALAEREQSFRDEAREALALAAEEARVLLDGVVARVLAAALRERAAQLGEIESVVEDPVTGEMVVRVRV